MSNSNAHIKIVKQYATIAKERTIFVTSCGNYLKVIRHRCQTACFDCCLRKTGFLLENHNVLLYYGSTFYNLLFDLLNCICHLPRRTESRKYLTKQIFKILVFTNEHNIHKRILFKRWSCRCLNAYSSLLIQL